jgi:Protein of unknown function (DUF3618)
MGQTASQIEAHIEHTREDLGSNLDQLERKVKSAADWRHQFQERPALMLGAAFGGGIFLATMLGGRKARRRREGRYPGTEAHAGSDTQKHKALETWDNVKGALIGLAASRFKDYVGEIIPGFREEFKRTEEKAQAH